jgi:hypothetical protein
MCCFSGPVRSVSNTRIFARDTGGDAQILVYSMKLSSDQELAMVLGLPVRPGAGEGALRFINLQGYPDIFAAFDEGFIRRQAVGRLSGDLEAAMPAPLAVIPVGSFEASYVPTVADFDRLDLRFRLPASVLEAPLGQERFGFAVFKLKPGNHTIHPMAFEFPRADPSRLFFPTVHVHDGRVHPTADFDHTFYYQRRDGEHQGAFSPWQESSSPAKKFTDPGRSAGVIDPRLHVYRWTLWGNALNQGTYI